MNKPLRYTLAVLACIACYMVCILLMLATGIGGIIAMVATCYFIKYVWNGIVHYGEESEMDKIERELEEEQKRNESAEQ